MSAKCQKRKSPPLFYHLVGDVKEVSRDHKAEHLCGLEVDEKSVIHRRLHRQIAWLFSLEDAIDIRRRAPHIL